MLMKFRVSNFRSFKDDIEFSMEPTREKVHRDSHLFSVKESTNKDLLRTAVLFGANASGKSNFIRAFEFAKKIVTKGLRPKQSIACPYFKLDQSYKNKSSIFYFEVLAGKKMYSYEFHLSTESVVFEQLKELTKSSEKLLFSRTSNEGGAVVEFSNYLEKQHKSILDNITFVAEGTRRNQLFLTETLERNLKLFEPVYDWFNDTIKIFSPTSIGHGIEFRIGQDERFTKFLRELLSSFDPSIADIKSELGDAELASEIPARVLQDIESELDEGDAVFMANIVDGNRSVILKQDDELKILKICIERTCQNNDGVAIFELEEESDGTRRLIDLAPLFFELLYTDKMVVALIDELDRSLHPLATKILLEVFLKKSSQNQSLSQVIISTHNSTLLDLELLRKDEIWLMDKREGGSQLLSLQRNFSPRYDRDIRKEYLEGSYGGIPKNSKTRLFQSLLDE
ncbi:AAA family ATPase [Pseudoalteromonas galatheae]|uniref:AAA family ATPase n=1 Tax=Pseudoalteromonas galatheae TaxID=579562 RepID=UPI0030D5F5F5